MFFSEKAEKFVCFFFYNKSFFFFLNIDVVVGGRENDGVVVSSEIRSHLAEEGNPTSGV